jgi:hypothetical protein
MTLTSTPEAYPGRTPVNPRKQWSVGKHQIVARVFTRVSADPLDFTRAVPRA